MSNAVLIPTDESIMCSFDHTFPFTMNNDEIKSNNITDHDASDIEIDEDSTKESEFNEPTRRRRPSLPIPIAKSGRNRSSSIPIPISESLPNQSFLNSFVPPHLLGDDHSYFTYQHQHKKRLCSHAI